MSSFVLQNIAIIEKNITLCFMNPFSQTHTNICFTSVQYYLKTMTKVDSSLSPEMG